MLKGSATSEGTAAYRAAQGAGTANGHFREWRGLSISSLGIGTYLGPDDDTTDTLYEAAVERAIVSGINVVDSAINYRGQRSERAVGRALGRLVGAGGVARAAVVVATKGGFLPFDGPAPWFGRVKASGMARLYGSWTTRKRCSGPPTSSASATRSGNERKSRAACGWRKPLQVDVP